MYDHERSLVQKWADKPFALVGVNTDKDLNKLRQVVVEKEIIWRSFYDGQGGPISASYNIEGFPTLFVLDQHGAIHYVGHGDGDWEKLIETLLADMTAG